jgi:hypothetical protein
MKNTNAAKTVTAKAAKLPLTSAQRSELARQAAHKAWKLMSTDSWKREHSNAIVSQIRALPKKAQTAQAENLQKHLAILASLGKSRKTSRKAA